MKSTTIVILGWLSAMIFDQTGMILDFEDPSTHTLNSSKKIEVYFGASTRVQCNEYVCSTPAIKEVAEFLNAHPNYIVEIGVHTDTRGVADANKRFSEMQANNVAYKIIELGVKPENLIPVGYGEMKPLISDSIIALAKSKQEIDSLHWENIRTVITLVEIK